MMSFMGNAKYQLGGTVNSSNPVNNFFVFIEEFRMQYKENNPYIKSTIVTGKVGGNKWK